MENHKLDININFNIDDRRSDQPILTHKPKVKIVTQLSVSQLAYLFRILYKMKKIKAANQTDIIKFISETFETDNVADISLKSIRSKYYNVEDKEKEATSKQLMEIVQFIRNDRS